MQPLAILSTAGRARVALLVALLACMPTAGPADSHPKRTQLAQATAGRNDNSNPIKIGFLAELSGVAADPGRDMLNGIQLFMDEIKGQIAGRKIQLIVENVESSAATGVIKTKQLISTSKVDVLSGLMLTNIAYAVAPIAERTKTPLVISVASADDLTQRKHSPWVVRSGSACSSVCFPMGEYAAKILHYKKIVSIAMDYPYGYESVGGFQKAFEQAGGQIIQKIWAPLGFQDFTNQIKQINPGADAIFLNTTSKAAEILPKQLRSMGVKLPIVASGASFDESILPLIGDAAIGAMSSSEYSATLDNPANKKFVQAYRAKYHQDPGRYAEDAYTGGMLIKKAIESLHGDVSDKEKLMTAMQQVELDESPRGPFKLDSYGNPVQNMYLRRVEKKNGKLQNTVIQTFPKVSQFWIWKPEEYLKQPPYNAAYPPCTFCVDK